MNGKPLPCNSPFVKLPFGGLRKEMLQLIAVVLMLCDHIWATYMSFGDWLTYIGRLAFPIFAFFIAEGFCRTSDVKKYALRLLGFGIISEIPFNLFYSSRTFNPYHQNVMFTLLLGLLAIIVIDRLKKDRSAKNIALSFLWLLLITAASVIGFVDYGFLGVMTVVMFYLFRDFPFAWLCQLLGMVLINIVFFEGRVIPAEFFGKALEIPTQGFAVLSLVPIWLYGGKRFGKNRVLQYGFYAFYPAHMLVLYLIRYFA